MIAVLPLAVSTLAFLTLGSSAALFLGAVMWVARPGGMSVLERLAPREFALRRVRRRLRSGDWQGAFAAAGKLGERVTSHSFRRRLLSFEGDCLYHAAELSLQAGRYGEALELMRGAGDRLGLPEAEFDRRVVELILAEMRRRVVGEPASADLEQLARHVFRIRAGHAEASFWLAWHQLHAGQPDAALNTLQDAAADPRQAEAPLYLGVLLRRSGRARESLRWLNQATWLAPACPIAAWQFGEALLENGGDAAAAVKALELAVGPAGYPKFADRPGQIWASLTPVSWLAGLSRRSAPACPFGLDRPPEAMTAVRRALAVALARCDRATDAAAVYYQAFAAGDDSTEIRRGLGLSLARAGLYDDARPHLEAAVQSENPPSPISVGFLALCTARAGAAVGDDPSSRLSTGIDVLTSIEAPGDAEWARLARELFREARSADVAVSSRAAAVLAANFAAVDATDAVAVDAYGLCEDPPFAVAATYIRAAAERSARLPADAQLFELGFRQRDVLRRYFSERRWEFQPAELVYLTRWAEAKPGRYPDAPGPQYAAIAEATLLDESRRCELIGRPDLARAAVELAARLGPTRALTFDRLAEFAFRGGDRVVARQHLNTWLAAHASDYRPLVRLALLDYCDSRPADALAQLAEACERTAGTTRSRLLVLTARVALAADQPEAADELIEQARFLAPGDDGVLLITAAIAWSRRRYQQLKALAPQLESVRGEDPQRALLAGVALFLAGDADAAMFAADAAVPAAPVEAACLRALVLGWQNHVADAVEALNAVPRDNDAAHVIRARLAWQVGDYTDALAALDAVSPEGRRAWKLESAGAAFLAGGEALAAGRSVEALALFRRAADGRFTHDLLPAWMALARQRADLVIRGCDTAVAPLRALKEVLSVDGLTPARRAWLARGYRRQGAAADAFRLLTDARRPDVNVDLQLGLLHLEAGRTAEALELFLAARASDPESSDAAYNLAFARLSSGDITGAYDELLAAADCHAEPVAARLLRAIAGLVVDPPNPGLLADLSADEELKLVRQLQRLGRLDVTNKLIGRLAAVRPTLDAVRQARVDLAILTVKDRIDRGQPAAALMGVPSPSMPIPKVLRNLLGVAAGLTRDYDKATQFFQLALPTAGDDARVRQNLALVAERSADADRARLHWRRYLANLTAHCPTPAGNADYLARLADFVRLRLDAAAPVEATT